MAKTALEIIQEDRAKLSNIIVENLNSKGLGWFKEWSNLATPQNGTNDTKYRGGNKVKLGVIALDNNFQDPRWATMKQIKDKGWSLVENPVSVMCEYWKFFEKEDKETGELKKIPMVNYFRVYNFSQIKDSKGNFLEPFKIPEREKNQDLQKVIVQLEKTSKCPINYTLGDRAYYSSKSDIIVLPSPDLFKDDKGHISTLLHEMAHSTGHETRLDRQLGNKFGTPEYAREELRAEISSMFLLSELGIKVDDREFNNNQEYIKGWVSVLQNDPNEIYRASADADKITDYIIEEYNDIEKSYELEKATKELEKDNVVEVVSPIKEKEKSKTADEHELE